MDLIGKNSNHWKEILLKQFWEGIQAQKQLKNSDQYSKLSC